MVLSIKIIASVLVVIIIVVFVYKYYNSNQEDTFVNEIDLPLNYVTSFDSVIDGDSIVVSQGKLFCVSLEEQNIYVVDLHSGKLLDSIKVEKEFKFVRSAIKEDTIYFIFENKYLYLLDTNTLNIKNIFYDGKARYYGRKFIIYNDTIIASDGESFISLINVNNGEIIINKSVWHRDIELKDDILFYWGMGFNIFAVEPNTLNLIWKYFEDGNSHVHSNVAFFENEVYYHNFTSLKIFDFITGKVLSEYPLNASDITIFNNTLYSILFGENISCLNRNNGNLNWRMDVNTGGMIFGDGIFTIDKSNQNLKKFDLVTGELIWSTDWINNYIYKITETIKYSIIQSRDGSIYLLDKSTGDKLWKFSDVADSKEMFWTMHDENIIIFDGEDKIYAFEVTN